MRRWEERDCVTVCECVFMKQERKRGAGDREGEVRGCRAI